MMQTAAQPPASPTSIPAIDLYPGSSTEYVDRSARRRDVARAALTGPDFVTHPSAAPVAAANDDLSLVQAMARGDERAAGALYDRHSAVMYGLAVRMVIEPADAEEVILDAFAQAWREAPRYDAVRGSVVGWLTTIVRTRALDAIRARTRRAKMTESAATEVDAPVAMSTGVASPDRAVEEGERAVAVGTALAALPEPQRRAIELAFFEGLTHQEVAERLREPLGTIKTRIRLGMLKLRELLGALAPEPAP